MPRVAFGAGGGADSVRLAMQDDRRHADWWPHRQLRLAAIVGPVARSVAVTMPVGLNDDIDEIRVVEGRSGQRVVGIGEAVVWRPEFP